MTSLNIFAIIIVVEVLLRVLASGDENQLLFYHLKACSIYYTNSLYNTSYIPFLIFTYNPIK